MGDLIAMAMLVFGVIIMVLVSIIVTTHHCDKCGKTLVNLTGSRWCCPKCGKNYRIGKLGLGKQIEI